jgi:hypothetical protein
MIIQFSLQANSERVLLRAPQADFYERAKNVMAYGPTKNSKRSIFAVGYDAADLQNLNPAEWAKRQPTAGFAHPFDAEQFSPEFAVTFLNFYAIRTHILIRGRARTACFFDRFDYDLEIKDYDALPAAVQDQFVYELRRSSVVKIQRLIINGQDTAEIYRQQARVMKWLRWTETFWLGVICAAWLMLFSTIAPAEWQNKPISGIVDIVVMVALLATIVGLTYVSAVLGALSTTLILRHSIPPSPLKMVLRDARRGLSRSVAEWLVAMLPDETP